MVPINVSSEHSIAALPLRASTDTEESAGVCVPVSAASCTVGKIHSGESTTSGNNAAASFDAFQSPSLFLQLPAIASSQTDEHLLGRNHYPYPFMHPGYLTCSSKTSFYPQSA
ncbi:hypothetical protein MHU86_4594 [Fragilaria crotonensis]|nr:hypothetical protein MHU86_4594 [Fragilaria crotonensis]